MNWTRRIGIALSCLTTLFFLMDAAGKLFQLDPVVHATLELGWPQSAVLPLGVLLLVGAVLHAVPRTSVLGAIYLTAFLGGAVATHYRLGSPLATHVLFGVYVGAIMWLGLALRYPALSRAALSPRAARPAG
ncbi:MAG: DoxX family protein [Proteobacteria bacterium]|nr:DoxX family protein [Pseudomonadota bacterium]